MSEVAQAANVIAFPTNKLSFKALKIDAKAVIGKYDGHRQYVAFALALLSKTPAKLKKDINRLSKTIEGGQTVLKGDVVGGLISDFENMTKDYLGLAEIMDAAAARLIAAQRGLI